MPLPKPNSGESHDDFIGRCMSKLSGEFPDEKQRYAVCETQWEGKSKRVMIGIDESGKPMVFK
jgi:hypothetical protein